RCLSHERDGGNQNHQAEDDTVSSHVLAATDKAYPVTTKSAVGPTNCHHTRFIYADQPSGNRGGRQEPFGDDARSGVVIIGARRDVVKGSSGGNPGEVQPRGQPGTCRAAGPLRQSGRGRSASHPSCAGASQEAVRGAFNKRLKQNFVTYWDRP